MTASLSRSLEKAFINHTVTGSHYDPKLIINDVKKKEYLLNVLHHEMETCTEFFFSVAFLTQDGLASLKTQLHDLNKRGVKGRILTSVYLAFNHPDVFKDLLTIPNIEVRISKKEGFHSKGYLFKQPSYHSFIVGSSNLTMAALKVNYEWNVRLTSYNHGQMIQDIYDHMEHEWFEAEPLTGRWIENYQKSYTPQFRWTKEQVAVVDEEASPYITPNAMQKAALRNLAHLRARNERKGIVVSATGTGKTYLSALDVAQAKPKKVLFVVHREQILNKAKQDYRQILGGKESDYGILSGSKKEAHARYVFATVQTLSKKHVLDQFDKEQFDYILIDEVHKAGAQSYHTVLNYFEPEFLLGMTATPERTDGFNIFELFDYNLAYEIRLQEALEADLLCPFHYFGITDFEKNGELISEEASINDLVEDERIDYIVDKVNYYGSHGNQPKGLVFCSCKEEAVKLSYQFNKRKIASTYLLGEHSLEERERAIQQLENGELKYIFTVDIFNEGIDIPKINQVIMLRNTQSSIIFVQQLGRGLRKHPSKDYVTVIDFIGNYKNNYMIPMALSGDVTRNKNNLRKDTYDTGFISGVSSVNFEEVAKKKIFESINTVKIDSKTELKKQFDLLYNRLGRVPFLKDFQLNHTLDPYVLANYKKSYYDFLVSVKENKASLTDSEQIYLMIASRELLTGMRKQELLVLKEFLSFPEKSFKQDDLEKLFRKNDCLYDKHTIKSVISTLDLSFFRGTEMIAYKNKCFVRTSEQEVTLASELKEKLKRPFFKHLLEDIVVTGLMKSEDYSQSTPLTRYKKYKRKDVLRLLNWEKQIIPQNIGGYKADDGEFVIFITLQKGEDFEGAQMAYEDELLDNSTLKWFSKVGRKIDSPEIKKLQKPEEWTTRVFMKKSDDEGTDFYYLGEVNPVQESIKQISKPVKDGTERSVVEMKLKFIQPIESNLYHYLTLDE